jgi:hypothetical protein
MILGDTVKVVAEHDGFEPAEVKSARAIMKDEVGYSPR